MIGVLLADDHSIVRRGLSSLIAAERGIRVVGEAGDGLEALRLIEELRPRVLIADLMMPGLSGLELTRRVQRSFPATHVLILSMHAEDSYVAEALRAGATGYVLKGKSIDVGRAIRAVAAGERYLDPSLSDAGVATDAPSVAARPLDSYEILTAREREVLHQVADGKSSSQIATRLTISRRTVEIHRRNILRKLRLHTHTDLVRFAIRCGIIPLR